MRFGRRRSEALVSGLGSSTLAIDPDNGDIKWHYQGTPHDGWDFDGVNEFIPFELKQDGQTIHAGAKADRGKDDAKVTRVVAADGAAKGDDEAGAAT